MSSVSSYNPMREPFHRTFGSSLSFQSSAARSRSSIRDAPFIEGERFSLSSNVAHPRLSVAEVLYDSAGGFNGWAIFCSMHLTYHFLPLLVKLSRLSFWVIELFLSKKEITSMSSCISKKSD